MAMAATPALLHLISITYLLLISVLAQDDPCYVNDTYVCGPNSICSVVQNLVNCSCPPGFEFTDKGNPFKGCFQNSSQRIGCDASNVDIQMQRLDNVDWPGNDYEHYMPMNESACQQACLIDCLCTVAIYAHINDIDNCWKKTTPLLNGGQSETRTAFIKVSKANEREEQQGQGEEEEDGIVVVVVLIILAARK